jgi:hypothetical protein
MATVQVQAGQSLLKSYVKTPPVGLCELVWNAFDEDATTVEVLTEYNDFGGLEEIHVRDDGNGMTLERANLAFSRVGDSWKMMDGTVSASGARVVHGRHGRGRYSAFSLGSQVLWMSVSPAIDGGELATVRVSGQSAELDRFDVSEIPTIGGSKGGTTVTIGQVSEEAVRAFDQPDTLRQRLLTEFALHLQRYDDFTIRFLGVPVDPMAVMQKRTELEVPLPEGIEGQATLTVIEWDLEDVRRAIYLCDASDRVVDEVEARIQAPGLEFTAYLKWDGFSANDPLGLEDDTESAGGRLIASAREVLKEHLHESARHREAQVIQRWREEGVYPYKAKAETPIDEAKQATFNVVAMAASRAVDENKSRQSKALSLSLLKQTVENDPEALLPILHDVAKLPQARIEELADLLKHTSLTQLIQAGKAIGSRLEFLAGLNTILFERQIKKRVLERRQLHRILAHETWIFGEEWSLTGDDERLTVVLKKFLSRLGKEVELASLRPVLREDGSDAIPDLVLGRQRQCSEDKFEQLVVELKRPRHRLTDEDVTQIRSYASAITNDESFDQPNVHWEFWLVGNEMTTPVDEQRQQSNFPHGVVQDSPKYRIHVKTWAEIISDCEHRLKFVQKSLQYETSNDHGLAYLREKYAAYLPDEVAAVERELQADAG